MVLAHLKLWRLSAKVTRLEEWQTHSNLHTHQGSYGYIYMTQLSLSNEGG